MAGNGYASAALTAAAVFGHAGVAESSTARWSADLQPKQRGQLVAMASLEGTSPTALIQQWVQERWSMLCDQASVRIGQASDWFLPFTPDGPNKPGDGRARLLPLDPLRKLEVVAKRTTDRRLLVSWTTGGEFAKMALNLALSVRLHVPALEASLALVSLDSDAHALLRNNGFFSVLMQGPTSEDAVKNPWHNDELWKFKYKLMALVCTGSRH